LTGYIISSKESHRASRRSPTASATSPAWISPGLANSCRENLAGSSFLTSSLDIWIGALVLCLAEHAEPDIKGSFHSGPPPTGQNARQRISRWAILGEPQLCLHDCQPCIGQCFSISTFRYHISISFHCLLSDPDPRSINWGATTFSPLLSQHIRFRPFLQPGINCQHYLVDTRGPPYTPYHSPGSQLSWVDHQHPHHEH
jgi:hypothetical protein